MRIITLIFIIFANSFLSLILVIILFSISYSQESGALDSWFDNNYKLSLDKSGKDKNRIEYTAIKGRVSTFRQAILATVFILGGLLSDFTSRRFLFVISTFGFVLMCTALFKLKDD